MIEMILQSKETSVIKKQMKVSVATIRTELKQKHDRKEHV